MAYFFEIWMKGIVNDYAKSISPHTDDSYHPHITLVRPFSKIYSSEEDITQSVAEYCAEKEPIPFYLEGRGDFNGEYFFIPVVHAQELLEFDAGLEELLQNRVMFHDKLDSEKNLHLTINTQEPISPVETIEQYMLRLTAIKDKRIWFSYDFVTHDVLNRDESLDEELWKQTVELFYP